MPREGKGARSGAGTRAVDSGVAAPQMQPGKSTLTEQVDVQAAPRSRPPLFEGAIEWETIEEHESELGVVGLDVAQTTTAGFGGASSGSGTTTEPRRSTEVSVATADTGRSRGKRSAGKSPTNPEFVNKNRSKILTAIAERIAEGNLPPPHARLWFTSNADAKDAFGREIWEYADRAPQETLKQLAKLTHPADLIGVVDDARRGPDGTRLDVALIQIAAAFDEPLRHSILRMGTRTVVKLDDSGGIRPHPSTIIASSPLDGLVAEVLLVPTLTSYGFTKKGAPDDTGGRPFKNGVDGLKYEWMGSRDRNLWNWIHVTSPANPTAEHVAQLNLHGEGNQDSEQAYRIAVNLRTSGFRSRPLSGSRPRGIMHPTRSRQSSGRVRDRASQMHRRSVAVSSPTAPRSPMHRNRREPI